jgi:hypothetical protein
MNGVLPRILKKPLSNTLSIILYEYIFFYFEKKNPFWLSSLYIFYLVFVNSTFNLFLLSIFILDYYYLFVLFII